MVHKWCIYLDKTHKKKNFKISIKTIYKKKNFKTNIKTIYIYIFYNISDMYMIYTHAICIKYTLICINFIYIYQPFI